MGALCLNCGKLELVAWSWRFSRIFCPVVLRELRLMVCLVQVLMSYLVCHRVVFLVHCCFCCTLLTFLGCFRIELVGYADDSTLLCRIPHPRDRSSEAASLNDDLAVISDWCSRWGMLVNPSKTRGMLISRSRTVETLFPDLLIDGSVVEIDLELKILGVIIDSKLSFEKQVRAIATSASMRVGILRKTMSVFSRCRCSCQMLLGIYTPCARVLFSCLDVCSHFSPVIAWSCCQPGWPIKRWKCQRRSLAQAQSGISECLLQDWQFGWSPCAWSFSSAVCVEETNPCSLSCSLSIFRDA